ncbi:unnamed protein product [Closterium sp. NIES-54]
MAKNGHNRIFQVQHTLFPCPQTSSPHLFCPNTHHPPTHRSLSNNILTGTIPSNILTLPQLAYLYEASLLKLGLSTRGAISGFNFISWKSLSNNNLTGSIPHGISVLVQLTNLSSCAFPLSSPSPSSCMFCFSWSIRRIHGNRLGGSLPSSLSRLVNLVNLNLFANNLSGEIPPEIGGLTSLKYFNPRCVREPMLMPFAEISRGSSISSSESSSAGGGGGVSVGGIIGIVVAAVVVLLLLGATLLYVRREKTGTSSILIDSDCTEFSLAEVIEATNDWSRDNQLASGAFGDVFKGVSPRDGTEWAVKRARLIDMDFQKEVSEAQIW